MISCSGLVKGHEANRATTTDRVTTRGRFDQPRGGIVAASRRRASHRRRATPLDESRLNEQGLFERHSSAQYAY